MRPQLSEYDCAAAALSNSLRALGKYVGRSKLLKLLDPDGLKLGADQEDILRAIHKLGITCSVIDTSVTREAELWLKKWVAVAPLMVCVDRWGHWVTIAGQCDRRYCVQDPGRDEYNTRELHQHWLRSKTILRRWRAAMADRKEWLKENDDGGGLYYGIVILPSNKGQK